MNYLFKKNTLFRCMFSILSIGVAPCVIAQQSSNISMSMQSDEAQQFYQQYYIKQEQLTPEQVASRSQNNTYLNPQDDYRHLRCSGTWITPVANNTPTIKDPKNATSTITAEEGYYNPKGTSVLKGNVEIEQQGRKIFANQVELDETQTHARASGKVQLAQDGFLTQSDSIDYNLKTETGDLKQSYYINEEQQAHGYAESIERTSPTQMLLKNVSYSTCEPSSKPQWHIQANEIILDQETGRGVTRNARLYIKNVPIIPIPYFNFPIDNRRTTGFLYPTFGYTTEGGLQLSVPYYLNLAPNYDLTLTPKVLLNRGVMLNANFRYLTQKFGSGRLWGGYLPNDHNYNGQDRKDLHWNHFWQINPQFSTSVDFNYVSDKDFFSDLNNVFGAQDEVYQKRTWLINYDNGIPGLKAQLKTQTFQTLDPTITDANKPYFRLPQLLVSYEGGNYTGWEYSFLNDTAYFKKSIHDNSSAESSGTRQYNQATLRYNFRRPGYFITPEFGLRSLATFFDKNSVRSGSTDKTDFIVVPQFNLDMGMTFERQGRFLHTLTPRLFYAYAPYRKQNGNPNFDTAQASIGYDQLFSPYRFYGHDRLEDNNFASFGINYSLYDSKGLERLRAGLGQSIYFSDRRVRLNANDPTLTDRHSGSVLTLASQLTNSIYLTANSAWLSNGRSAQNNLSLNYTDQKGRLYNLGYYYRRQLPEQNQLAYRQIATSIVYPLNENWRLLGHAQYDLHNHITREWLVGVNYESCCWGVSVYARSYYNDLDDPTSPTVSSKKAIMAEFSLKGLGGLGGKLASLLENRVNGFNDINKTWNQY